MRYKPGREIWKVIKGYPAYLVSNHGRVKSFKSGKPKLLKAHRGIYRTVGLSNNSKRKTHRIPRLVAIHFIRNPKNKPEINHKDGNKLNDHFKNLEWSTAKENSIHRTKVLNKRNSPYTKKQILEIRKLALTHRQKDICKIMGITKSVISKIINRQSWSYL